MTELNGQGGAGRAGYRIGGCIAMLVGLMLCGMFVESRYAVADHVVPGVWSGTVRDGGTVTFTVSGDGSRITSFTASGVPGVRRNGRPCVLGGSAGTAGINGHNFRVTATTGDLATVNGRFNTARTAGGSLSMDGGNCRLDEAFKNWSATAQAAATPTPTVTPRRTPRVPRLPGRRLAAGCLDFRTQAEAQRFFDRHRRADRFGLDTDGDGVACEGLGQTVPTAARRPAGSALPKTGVATTVSGISGLTLLVSGFGLTRFARRREQRPVHAPPDPEGQCSLSGWMPYKRVSR